MPEHKTILEFGLDSGSLNKMADAVDKSLSKPAKSFASNIKKETAGAIKSAMQVAAADGRIGREWNNLIKKPFRDLESEIQKALRAGDYARAQSLQSNLRMQTKALQEELNTRKQAYEEIFGAQRKSALEHAKMLEGGADTLRSAISGGDFVNSIRQALEGGGGMAQRLGKALQGRAGEVAAAGKGSPQAAAQAQQLSKIGGAIAKIGTAAAAFAAVAGAIVLLIKLFMDLESRSKDMNKALLESGSAADFGFSRVEMLGGELTKTLAQIRQETTAVNENFLRFRASAKEQQEILAQLNQAGYTFREMRQDIDDSTNSMKSFSDVTALAITYSRTLGLSAQEAAQQMGKFTLETGLGLDDIAMQFSVITREAAAAGVQTKRFFETVSEATSGMAFYGVRIEETARLLSTFDSLLGEAAGTEAFKQLTGQFKDKGAQDTLREFILKDQEFVTRQFQQSYERGLARLSRDFRDQLGDKNLEELIRTATSEADLRQTLTELGFSPEQRSQIASLRRQQQAASGNTAAQLAAARGAGPGFDLALQLRSALPLKEFGDDIGEALDTAIKQNNPAVVAAIEQLQALTGKTQDEAVALANEASAQFNLLKELAESGGEVPEELKKLGFDINRQTGEIVRGYVDASGNVVTDNAQVIRDQFDFLTSTATEGEKSLEEALSKDQQIATEISRNITGLSNIFEQSVAAILEDIYGVIVMIADYLFKDDSTRRAELNFRKDAANRVQKAADRQQEVQKQLDDVNARIASGGETPELKRQREMLQTQLSQAEMSVDAANNFAEMAKNVSGADLQKEGVANITARLRGQAGDSGALTGGEQRQLAQYLESVGPGAMALRRDTTAGRLMGGSSLGQGILGIQDLRSATGERAAKQLGNQIREGMLADEGAVATYGKEGIEELAKAAEAAAMREYEDASKQEGFFMRSRSEVFEQQRQAALSALQVAGIDAAEDKRIREQQTKALDEIADNTKEENIISGFIGGLFNKAKAAQDLILPASGGAPIITDSADTILATKPGGAIDRAAGRSGGRGGNFQVNIYGGDENKVYQTVLRVAKEAGLV